MVKIVCMYAEFAKIKKKKHNWMVNFDKGYFLKLLDGYSFSCFTFLIEGIAMNDFWMLNYSCFPG